MATCTISEWKSDLINNNDSAAHLNDYLLAWNMNQHLITIITLPIAYMKYEVGDIFCFSHLKD